ncbi:MAG TPA: condensation domain-containing protein, partial [Pyrinomonadaceae bacterium]
MLGLARVGVTDNFFDLGGHSLLATRLMARIRESLRVEVALRKLFEAPTVGGLAAAVEEELRGGAKILVRGVRRAPREGGGPQQFPVSYAQRRLWFLDQLEPGSATYNIPAAVRLRGPLDLAALEQTFRELVRRHESLRTRFTTLDGQPVQVIDPDADFELSPVDLESLPEAEREAESRRLMRQEAGRGFDLSRGPLFRLTLLRLAPDEHVLLLVLHHIISDGWSMGVLVSELGALYDAFSRGAESPLEELPIQYADYAAWQREHLTGETLEAQLAYWRERLQGAPVLELPTDRPRPAAQSFRGATHTSVLSEELTGELRRVSRAEGVTLFMTLLAAFKILLYRYTGQQDLVVGTPVAGRTQVEAEGLIGFFVNTLAIRTQVEGGERFAQLLVRVREATLGAYAHQHVPFERLVEELQPERSLSHTLLFQVSLVLQNAPLPELELSGLSLSPVEMEGETAKFDVTLAVQEKGDELHARWEYNTDLFDAETIGRMAGHFRNLLAHACERPDLPASGLELLSAEERRRLLLDAADPTPLPPPDGCLHRLFEAQAARTPTAAAVVAAGRQLTYSELNEHASQLAAHLRALGVGAESRVGVCLERGWETPVALLGVLKAGAAYVPLDP